MKRNILLTSLIAVLAAALLGCWFHFVGILAAQGRSQARCSQVEIVILDSLQSGIVDREEVWKSVSEAAVGKHTRQIDLDSIEKALRARGEVMSAQVFTADEHTLAVRLTQRKPVVRFESGQEHWYADSEGSLFPVTNSVDVPVVTGRIAGRTDSLPWILGMVELARYIDSKELLRQEIGQIEVTANGDLMLYTRTPGPDILFGDSGDYVDKFQRLEAYWRNIAPSLDPKKTYRTINLKYNNQIICKQL